MSSPGVIYTPIQVDTRDPESMQNLGAKKSLGRPGQASEVATSFVFLASNEAAFHCMFYLLFPFWIIESVFLVEFSVRGCANTVCSYSRTDYSLLPVG